MMFLLLALLSPLASAATNAYFFWGDGCPHCEKEKPFLSYLEDRYPDLKVHSYEVWYNSTNAEFFMNLSKACGVDVGGVPTLFIGDEVVTGFSSAETTGKVIEGYVKECVENGCIDPADKLEEESCTVPTRDEECMLEVPLFGQINTCEISIPVLAVILGIADGFNACAMFVLLILLSILLRTNSRKRMALVAGIFILTSGLIYFLFMTVWLNAFIMLGKISIIYIVVGVIALAVGTINIKDFFFFGKGVSLKIPEKAKPKIFKRIRDIVNAASLPAMIATVLLLAISVNFVEFLCTFGFPMVFTKVLAGSSIPVFMKYLWLAVYQLFYMLDDTIVVVIVIATLSSKRVTQDYGKALKLISGILMLILGLVLLLRPQLLMIG